VKEKDLSSSLSRCGRVAPGRVCAGSMEWELRICRLDLVENCPGLWRD
jgi:hypothetical protein